MICWIQICHSSCERRSPDAVDDGQEFGGAGGTTMDNLIMVSESDLDDLAEKFTLDTVERSDLLDFILLAQDGEIIQARRVLEGASERVQTAVDCLIQRLG